MSRCAVLGLAALLALGVAAAPAAAQIAPIQSCVDAHAAANTITATWGYVSTSADEVTSLPGSDNFFSPSPSFQGQEVLFEPGETLASFQTTFDLGFTSSSAWHVLGIPATASLDSHSCFTPNQAPLSRAAPAVIGVPGVGRELALD